jgi:hypothetical protein
MSRISFYIWTNWTIGISAAPYDHGHLLMSIDYQKPLDLPPLASRLIESSYAFSTSASCTKHTFHQHAHDYDCRASLVCRG